MRPARKVLFGTVSHMPTLYEAIIGEIFHSRYRSGDEVVPFERSDLIDAARSLDLDPPKNLGDLIYTFRHRRPLPNSICETAPEGKSWVISGRGQARYAFELKRESIIRVIPDDSLIQVKVPDATPGIVARYALSDEQALLAKLRYNRLIDIFTGVTCYSIQNHLRTFVKSVGQMETDEVYIGLDRKGAHYVLPVQAKGGSDEIGVVQIEQDLALCRDKFPNLISRPIAAQFMADDVIALFEFDDIEEQGTVKVAERHYRLVPTDDLTDEELRQYRQRSDTG